jgi:hypothetical protein
MWNDAETLRTVSFFLQWISIALIFFGGFLQVGKVVVDRREKVISSVLQAPTSQPIHLGSAVIELVEDTDRQANNHFMDSGAYLAFARGSDALMILRSLDSFANQHGKNEVLWRSTLSLDLGDAAIGKPVRHLRDAEYLQLGFGQLKSGASIKSGSVIVTVNTAVRLQAAVPAQKVDEENRLFIRDLTSIKSQLE